MLPDSFASSIAAGDTITAEVIVDNGVATLALTDVTTGQTFTTQATPSLLDVSSAEWIAEAPAACFGASRCEQLTLANFGTVEFSGSSTTANGHVGTISDGSWSATSIDLGGGAGAATAAALSTDGSDFTVAFVPTQVTQPQVKKKAKTKPKTKPKSRPHRVTT